MLLMTTARALPLTGPGWTKITAPRVNLPGSTMHPSTWASLARCAGVPDAANFLSDQTGLFEQYGWNNAIYVWRGDETDFDGFNMEYGPDPKNHAIIPDNPLLGILRERWAQNVDFPGNVTALTPSQPSAPENNEAEIAAPNETKESTPAADKWNLWVNGPHLRGANIWQAIVIPKLDGLEFKGSGAVGPPFTQADFDALAAAGANYVSLSVPGLFTEKPPFELDPAVQKNLDHLLEMAANANLFATISVRTGPGRSEFGICCDGEPGFEGYYNDTMWEDAAAQDAWVEMWRATAARYRDNPNVAGYKLMVEPNSAGLLLDIYEPDEFYANYGGTSYDWNQLYPRLVAAIRNVDPNTPILIGGNGWSAVPWLPYVQPVAAERIVYIVHQYEPQDDYTHQEGIRNSYPGQFDTNGDGALDRFDRAWLENFLQPVADFSAKNGVPVAVDEFGVNRWAPGAAQFMDDEMALFEQMGMNMAYWEWASGWRPFVEDVNDMEYRFGPEPGNTTPVPNDLWNVVQKYWSRNTIRPSNFYADAQPPPAGPTRPDGAAQLTRPPAPASDQNPAFSPAGAPMIFTRFKNGYNDGPADLFLLNPDAATAPTLLATAPDSDNVNLPGSSWNAATGQITFASDREDSDEIWTMAADGSNLHRVTRHTGGYFIEPSFSADGEWIVFERDDEVPDDSRQGSIWKVRAGGSDLTELTDSPGGGSDDRQPNWSPAGDRILFQRRQPGSEDWNIFTMAPDGSDIRPVTTSSAGDTDASWSPDGRWIVYSSDHGGLPVPNIFIIPATGGEPVRVTRSKTQEDGAPSWSPDGHWIAFESHPGQDEETPSAVWRIAAPDIAAGDLSLAAPEPAAEVPVLAGVQRWFYMIDVTLEPEMVQQIADSDYDLVALDFISSEAENIDFPMAQVIEQLHHAPHPKQVIAYIDIGQAEDFRTYWQPGWGIGHPEWITGLDPDGWEGNYPVAYWDEAWRNIWLAGDGYIPAIVKAGFDGIYLDWVEAYSDENVIAAAQSEGVDPRREMVWWVADLAETARSRNLDFIVIAQNAAELAADEEYRDTIDAIAQEQVWFDGSADNDPPGDCPLPRTEAEVDTAAYRNSLSPACQKQYDEFPDSTLHVSSQEYLNDLILARDEGEKIFTIDYALEPENVTWIYETSRGLGFVPFAGNRALDQFIEPYPFTALPPATGVTPVEGNWWQPAINSTWQWQLEQNVDPSFEVEVYDIDLFDNEAAMVANLHAQGRKVICYISVGSWEEWRPDANQFPTPAIGNDYGGWPGEKWLDIRQIDLLAPIMLARLDECQAKGFDGVEPDNIDSFANDTGFPLTDEDQLNYNIWLANQAHARGLSIGLKNDPDQVDDLLPYFDYALTEDCFAEGWCEEMQPFITAGKPVFAAEYTDMGLTSNQFCSHARKMNFSAILKNRNLDAWQESCP